MNKEKESTLKVMSIWALILLLEYLGSVFVLWTYKPWHCLLDPQENWARFGLMILIGFNYIITCMILNIVPFIHDKMGQ